MPQLSYNSLQTRNRRPIGSWLIIILACVVASGISYKGYHVVRNMVATYDGSLPSILNGLASTGTSDAPTPTPTSTASAPASLQPATTSTPVQSTAPPSSSTATGGGPSTGGTKSNGGSSSGTGSGSGSTTPPPYSPPPSTGNTSSSTKPTDASTGPRVASSSTRSGGTLSGTYTGVHFTSKVTATGPLTLRDCTIDGGVMITDGPVIIDHCDINGWFGVVTDNTDPNKAVATITFSKITGPNNGDTMRIGAYTKFGDNSKYVNTLFEDSIIYSPYSSFGAGEHFDVLQFGGGRNSRFNRVVFSYKNNAFASQATNYVNNGTKNINVVFNKLWVEGGPVGYVLGGPMTINTCTIDRSTKHYGYVYPSPGTVLNSCTDDTGAHISGT